MKITRKLETRYCRNKIPSFSFEFFVPKTIQGVQNLYERMDRMYQTQPQFIDITWNAGGKSSQLSTDLVFTTQSVLGLETCMHLTCMNMSLEMIDNALTKAYESGCQNILTLRGDAPINSHNIELDGCRFHHAKDLVLYIRSKYGDHFDIGVAGYPEGHPEEHDTGKLMKFLKEKVDAGANFIITQMFYDVNNFIEWCKLVRKSGINIPIIPGIMPITSYSAFLRRAYWCQIIIPDHFLEKLKPVKDNDQMVRTFGTELIVDMCVKLLKSGYIDHIHLYTMNLEKAPIMILEKLKLLPEISELPEELPWRKSLNPTRKYENIRPIFWKKRPYSYVVRTSQWFSDEFPNGRFGDSSSPAFGDLDLCGHSLIRQTSSKCLELWSTPLMLNDISKLIIDYLKGNLKCLPWCDVPLNHEVDMILRNLVEINNNLIFTINSQPKCNGVSSSDKIMGWGPPNGYVYQKQYLEFLLPRNKFTKLQSICSQFPSLTYFAADFDGYLSSNNLDDTKVNAVTWGIFPNSEVLQPTIVERNSFVAWTEEFFTILHEWKLNLISNKAKESAAIIDLLIKDYLLVNFVDNDFITQKDSIYELLIQLY